MNPPPAPMTPAPMSPPPPAPPAPPKSSALKWILIGCGGVTVLGILMCGGCLTLVYFGVKKVINEGVAKVKPIIAQNETVKSEIGELRTISPRWEVRTERSGNRDTVHFTLDVEGDKGKGTVDVRMHEPRRNKNEVFVTLTFINAAGDKRTPLGTWKLYDDGKGNAGFTPVKELPPDAGDDPGE